MPHPTPSGKTSVFALGKQPNKDTLPTKYYKFKMDDFDHTPNPVRGDDTAEMGEAKLDKTRTELLGYDAVDVNGNGRFRAGNQGHLLEAFGLEPLAGGFQFWSGVNSTIVVTDDGGGPVSVDLLVAVGDYDEPLVAGERYTGAEVAAALEAALDANTTLSQTYTVTWDSEDQQFTIAHGGTTLTLHWTDCPMMANQLGFDHAADDSGATTYTSDEARDVTARHWFRAGENEVLGPITDAGGGPVNVDILSGAGAVAVAKEPYSPWATCAVIKAALDGDTTLTGEYTITYSAATNKYTIATDSGTLTIPWTNAANTIADELGFTADDADATTYTGDVAMRRPAKQLFVPYDSGDDFPYHAILDRVDPAGNLDLAFRGVRVNELTVEAEDKADLKLSWAGKALDWGQAPGGETLVDEEVGTATPNTYDPLGHIKLGGADFRIATSTTTLRWDEQVEPQQCEGEPYSVEPVERSAEVVMDVYLGSRDGGEIYRKVFFGGAAGTEPSTTEITEALDICYQSGAVVPGQLGSTERFAFRLECDEATLTNYTLPQTGGDLLHGDLTAEISRESGDWSIGLVNNMSFDDFYA